MSLLNDRTAKKLQGKFQGFFHEDIQLINARCPRQANDFDCGLYVIVIVEEFCRFIYEYDLGKQSGEEKYDKEFFDKFMNEINRCITAEYINQRRKQLKTLLESMSLDKNR
jgi:Ulp1 family protease